MKTMLYVWNNTIYVAARSYVEARDIVLERVKHFPSLVALICEESPEVLDNPPVYIRWLRGPAESVAKMDSGEEKIVVCIPFEKGVSEGAEIVTRQFTTLAIREGFSGTLRTEEVRGRVTLAAFPPGLVYSP